MRTCFLLCYICTYVRNCTCRGLGYSAELRRYISVICIDAFKTPFACIRSVTRGELTELLPTLTFITWVVRVYVHTYVIKSQSRGVWCLWDLGCDAEATNAVQMLCLTTGIYHHTHSAHHMCLQDLESHPKHWEEWFFSTYLESLFACMSPLLWDIYSVTCIMLPALQPTLGVREHEVHIAWTTLSVCSGRWSSRCACCTLSCSTLCWERRSSDVPTDSRLGPWQCSGRSGGAEWWGGCNCSLLHCWTAGISAHIFKTWYYFSWEVEPIFGSSRLYTIKGSVCKECYILWNVSVFNAFLFVLYSSKCLIRTKSINGFSPECPRLGRLREVRFILCMFMWSQSTYFMFFSSLAY